MPNNEPYGSDARKEPVKVVANEPQQRRGRSASKLQAAGRRDNEEEVSGLFAHPGGGGGRLEKPRKNDPAAVEKSPSDVAGSRRCEECGEPVVSKSGRARFCRPYCRYRHRDRQRYERNPYRYRAKSRRYYAEHREEVLEKAAERRAALPRAPRRGECSECGEEMAGRANRIVCSKRCGDRRYRRLHPDKVAEKQRRKRQRRREREGMQVA